MPVNKTSINFGLVYIPITYTSLLKNDDIDFKLLDKKTMSRIKYKKVSEDNLNKEVMNQDIVKAYEYETGKYVIFENKDFEKLKTEKDKTITIEKFVDINEIDPIYYNKPFIINALKANHAFYLLSKAMESKNKVGIAKTVVGQKETLIIIRSKNNRLYMNSLFFKEMIKDLEENNSNEKIDKKELEMAETLIDNMSGKFNINDYKDEYKEKLSKAIERKISGKAISKPKQAKTKNTKINDLMAALTESVKATNKKGKKK